MKWSLQKIEITVAAVVLVILLVWMGSAGVWSANGEIAEEEDKQVFREQIAVKMDVTKGLLGGTEKEYIYYTGLEGGAKKAPDEIVIAIDAGHGGEDRTEQLGVNRFYRGRY